MLEDKVYPETYYHHSQTNIEIDETPNKIQIQNLHIVGWILIGKQLVKLNFGTKANPHCIKINARLIKKKIK
jgi:hypothetical protein